MDRREFIKYAGVSVAGISLFGENKAAALPVVDPPFGLTPMEVMDWQNSLQTARQEKYTFFGNLATQEPYKSFVDNLVEMISTPYNGQQFPRYHGKFKSLFCDGEDKTQLWRDAIIYGDGFLANIRIAGQEEFKNSYNQDAIHPRYAFRIEGTNRRIIEYQWADSPDYRIVGNLDKTKFCSKCMRFIPSDMIHIAPGRTKESYPYGNSLLPLANDKNGVSTGFHRLFSANKVGLFEQINGVCREHY